MSEPVDTDGDTGGDAIDWDEAVDVICVGTSPGVAGYAMICAAAGFDVATVEFPSGGTDPETLAYLAAMTADLDGGEVTGAASPIRVRPVTITPGRAVKLDPKRRLDTFVGERLRAWSAECLHDPAGVLFTAVPDHVLTPMRTDTGELVTAAAVPAGGPAPGVEYGELIAPVYQDGRIAGALLSDGAGRRLVRAQHGIAFPIGPAATPVPRAPEPLMTLVSRPAGRFARLQPVEICPELRDE